MDFEGGQPFDPEAQGQPEFPGDNAAAFRDIGALDPDGGGPEGLDRLSAEEIDQLGQLTAESFGADADGGGLGVRTEGIVKSYNPITDYGFIVCEGVDRDIYFRSGELPHDFRAGADGFFPLDQRPVSFRLHRLKDGRPQARDIRIGCREGEPCMGIVRSYSEAKGFGFVVSSSFEGDIFFSKKEVPPRVHPGDVVGAKVRFVVEQDNTDKLRAVQMAFKSGRGAFGPAAPPMGPRAASGLRRGGIGAMGAMGAMGGMMGPPMPFMGNMGGPMRGMGGMGRMGFPPPFMPHFARSMPPPMYPPGAEVQGILKSYEPRKQFGLITAQGIPCEVYFSTQDVVGRPSTSPQIGQPVTFVIQYRPDGTPHAKLVHLDLEDEQEQESFGRVRSYSEKKGFGFFSIEGKPDDIYFQARDVPPELRGDPRGLEGTAAFFKVHRTPDGKPQARQVRFIRPGNASRLSATRATKRPAPTPAMDLFRQRPGQPPRSSFGGFPDAKMRRLHGERSEDAVGSTEPAAAAAQASAPEPPPEISRQQYVGIVSLPLDPETSFGLITCEEFDDDITFTDSRPDLEIGTDIKFRLSTSADGTKEAVSIEPVPQ